MQQQPQLYTAPRRRKSHPRYHIAKVGCKGAAYKCEVALGKERADNKRLKAGASVPSVV